MTELLPVQASTRSFLALLPLKLAPPPARGETLLRPDLQAMLAEVRLQPATLVTAPAGYGKTTLLAQWAGELSRTGAAVCWIGLDVGDRDPALLLAYLVRSFQLCFPGVGEQAWRILHSAADFERDWPLVAGALFSDLQAVLATPTFLIFDDVHTIADAPITAQLLGYLLRAAPPALHIVIASRRPINVAPLPRLRAEGLLVEVGQYDLSLSNDEAAALLEHNGVVLSPADLALLLVRTEGWALSLQLAARALARQVPAQHSSYLQTLDSNQEGLFDYLASEVLAELPAELLHTLVLAALPDQFDAALLVEVLGRQDTPELIERAQQLGLPLTALDEREGDARRRVYRFHPLLRRLLLQHAHTVLAQEERCAMQLRFGHALEARGNLEGALTLYAAAEAVGELARALRERAWPLINTPQRDIIRRWLDHLPEELRRHDPELVHMWGWGYYTLAPDRAAAAISQAAELYRTQGNYQRELRALSDLAALLFWEDRPHGARLHGSDDFAAICVRAVRAANRVRDTWARGTALVNVVALLYSRGRYNAALRVAQQAMAHPRSPFWQWLLALIVSFIHIQQGHPTLALGVIEEALLAPQIDRDDRLRQYLLRQQALALYLLGHESDATELALAAHQRLNDYYNDSVVGVSAAFLGLLLLEHGRLEEATTYLARARFAANRAGMTGLLVRVQVFEAYGLFRAGQGAQAAAAALDILRQAKADYREGPGARFSALGPSDLWLRLLLLITLGEGGETERAMSLAQELIVQMQARGDGLFLVIAQLYRAALAVRLGDKDTHAAALHAGWGLAEAQGYSFLPTLPSGVLCDVVADGLRLGLAPLVIPRVLRRQLPDQATTLLLSLARHTLPAVRARAAELLGDLGVTSAYPALRSLLKDRSPQVRVAADSALERLVYRPSYQLRVRSLGGFGVWRGDEEIRDRDWRSIKARQLLQFLLVERGRMLPRDRIMDTLWPGLESEAASNNLRVTLSRLTKALEPERPEGAPTYYLIQQGDTYGFNINSDHRFDAADFADAVGKGRTAERKGQHAEAIADYRQAIGLYGGVFLPDSLYEDWSVVERERLALLFNDTALRLGNLLLEEGQAHEAIGLAWRVLEQDQAQEEAYRLLMRAHARLGERSTAMRLYTRCVTALHTELGVEPMPETVALYEELRGIQTGNPGS